VERGEYKNSLHAKYPLLRGEIISFWLSDAVTKSSATDVTTLHLKQGDAHKYVLALPDGQHGPCEMGRRGKVKKCMKGPVQPSGTSPVAVAEAVETYYINEKACLTVPVRIKQVPDTVAYQTFIKQYPDKADITSRTYFVECCPPNIKPQKRDTCLCIHHLEGQWMVEDMVRNQRHMGTDHLKWGQAQDEAEYLHSKCGTPEGCQCNVCIQGGCKGVGLNPFTPFESLTFRDRLAAMKRICLCGEEQRTHLCYEGDCGECGWSRKLALARCPLVRGQHPCRYRVHRYETPAQAAAWTDKGEGEEEVEDEEMLGGTDGLEDGGGMEEEEEQLGEEREMNPEEQMDKELDDSTKCDGYAERYGKMRFSTIKCEYIPFLAVDHVHRVDAPAIDGIKSLHSFVQLRQHDKRGVVGEYC
jgi:hypothetical protein